MKRKLTLYFLYFCIFGINIDNFDTRVRYICLIVIFVVSYPVSMNFKRHQQVVIKAKNCN